MGNLKYTQVWDNKLKKYITPSEVNEAEAHDRNRYFSEKFNDNENKGDVLTFHKESKPFKRSKGGDTVISAHFSKIADNTKAYRETTAKQIKHQESLVHKLCKEVIKEIKYIKVPEVKATIMGVEYTVLHESVIEIEFKSTETRDKESGRIPDAVVTTNILGTKQELYIEFLYAHEVNEQKRKQFEYFKKNCLEVNMYHLKDNLTESEKSLRTKIKNLIENNCYWLTNSVQLCAEQEALHEYVLEIKKGGALEDSIHYTRNNFSTEAEWLYHRLFFFKDNLNVSENHPCYFKANPNIQYSMQEKCTNIGDCAKCNNCIWISNYSSGDTSNTAIYCKKSGDKKRVNPFDLVNSVINKAIKMSSIV